MKCRFVGLCRDVIFHYKNADNCTNEDSWDCPMAAKIEDLLMDVPFCEDYDGPEEEEDGTDT